MSAVAAGLWARRVMAAGTEFVLRWSKVQAGVALVYHQVKPGPSVGNDLVPTMPSERFEHQLRYVNRHYEVVPASTLHQRVARRRRGQRLPVAVTFDDDSLLHVTEVLPIVRRHGVQVTFFLCGASLESPYAFWWERLQRMIDRSDGGSGPEAGVVEEARTTLLRIEALAPADRTKAAEELVALAGPDPDDAGLRAEHVAALAAAGQEIGFHTREHQPLPALDNPQLASALFDGRAELEAVVGHPLDTVAYPHGQADDRVAAAARDAAFTSGFTTEAQPVLATTDPLLMGRVDPTEWSSAVFGYVLSRVLWKGRRPSRSRP